MRLNGIACRTVGRYKCPKVGAYQHHLPLEPDFNHVWIEFFLPGFGWVPMESNPDDLTDSFHYPTRFFMGLAWYHAEIAKDISFERVLTNGTPIKELPEPVSIGDLALNHIRFTVLRELPPLAQE
jgi:transglutaminase-like putative cysteine protease